MILITTKAPPGAFAFGRQQAREREKEDRRAR